MLDQSLQLRRLMLSGGRSPGGSAAPPPRIVVISGGKTGLGATTLAVHLTVALAQHGSRTVLVDADLAGADVAARCGLRQSVGIADVLLGRKNIHEALQLGPAGVQVVVGACTAEARNACTERALARMLRQIQSLGRHADVVVIDLGSGSDDATLRFWQAADDVLLVTTPDAVAVMDTYATIKILLGRAASAPLRQSGPLQLVVNGADSAAVAADVHRRIDQSCQRFLGVGVPLAGWLPGDQRARGSPGRGQSAAIAPHAGPLATAVDVLAELLLSDAPRLARQPRRAA